jgi:hypothetical protein
MQLTFGEAKGTNKRGKSQILFGLFRARVPSTQSKVVQIERKTKFIYFFFGHIKKIAYLCKPK